jgi:hypothetical protein
VEGWRTFVHNHADAIASIDMFVVPTISFGLLYGLLILLIGSIRRECLDHVVVVGVREAGNDGFTSITMGSRITPPTGAMSRRKLKLSFSYSVVLIAFAE